MKVAKIEEREEGVLRRRVKQRNDQNIELTKTRCTTHGYVVLSVNRAVESNDNEAACQKVEDVIGEEIEKSEKHNTIEPSWNYA